MMAALDSGNAPSPASVQPGPTAITVRTPGGHVVTFPPGTDAQTVSRVMDQALGTSGSSGQQSTGGLFDDLIPQAAQKFDPAAVAAAIPQAARARASFRSAGPGQHPSSEAGLTAPGTAAPPTANPFEDLVPSRQFDPAALAAAIPAAAQARAATQGNVNRGNPGDTFFNGVLQGFGPVVEGVSRGVGSAIQGQGFGPGYAQGKASGEADLAGERYRHPIVAGASELAGNMVPAMAIPGAMGGASLATKIGKGALGGAALGAVSGAGYSDGDLGQRLDAAATGAKIGALSGGAVSLLGSTVGRFVGGVAGRALTPTADMLKAQAGKLYDAAKASGLVIRSGAFDNLVNRVGQARRIARR